MYWMADETLDRRVSSEYPLTKVVAAFEVTFSVGVNAFTTASKVLAPAKPGVAIGPAGRLPCMMLRKPLKASKPACKSADAIALARRRACFLTLEFTHGS